MKGRETKSRLRMEIKEITAAGEFEGLLSPYGNVDDGGDMVEPGAYTKTLKDRGAKVPLLWQHKADCPVGELFLEDRADGLWCRGKLLMDLQEAKKAYLLMKAKIVRGLSIGFQTVKDSIEGGVRHLKEIRLFEGSVVTFQMNELALITSVKGKRETKDDFNEELQEIQTLAAFYQLMQALYTALSDLRYSDLTRDEKISAADTIVQQFSDAFSAFFPAYLDTMAEAYGPQETWSREEIEIKTGLKSAKTKRVDGVDLTADCFAYVGDKEDTSTWKLPIKFPGDEEKTKSHIRNALARFSQTQGIPEAERAGVLAKIHAAAKKHGIDVTDKAVAEYEAKLGAMISATNAEKIKSACEQIKGGHDSLLALLDDKAGATTLQTKAAGTETEPVSGHSETEEKSEADLAFERLMSLIPA